MKVTDEILNEWSFRCHDGIVDLNDPKKLRILKEILDENGITEINLDEIGDVNYDDVIKKALNIDLDPTPVRSFLCIPALRHRHNKALYCDSYLGIILE